MRPVRTLRISVGDVQLDAVLWESPAALDLLKQVPLTLEFSGCGDPSPLSDWEAGRPVTIAGVTE
ncbi:hypothetical protein [Kocuria palustris]|uniref:hypothetical protein n=1 Tax=Kocuria palustris TaxID=71999 RepID=UPI0011A40E00|nr:hypothetical protein [Kocuria palustris]